MENNPLCCFIVPYFGTLPNTTPLFLKTCASNPDYNWLIITDDHAPLKYPSNVSVMYCSFFEFRSRIQSCFDFEIALNSPKKLCDFKPAYGYILSKELQQYPFWGYCDLDQCFGNLSCFIPREVLEQYDKLFTLGHMTIYRNTPYINALFMQTAKNPQYHGTTYRDIFSTPVNCCFDEWPETRININVLAEEANLRINTDVKYIDVDPFRSEFLNTVFDAGIRRWSIDPIGHFVIVWHNGIMKAIWRDSDNILKQRDVLYVHLQKRKMNIKAGISDANAYAIYPNTVCCFECAEQITEKWLRNHLRYQILRRVLKIDETKHRGSNFAKLWNHRFHKYILRDRH